MGTNPEVLVLTPQEAQLDDLEVRLDDLTEELRMLPDRLRPETAPPARAPEPEREAQLRAWAD